MNDATIELPADWESLTVEEMAEPRGIAYGVLKPGPPSPTGVPMLRVSDVRDGRVQIGEIYKISPELDAEFRRTKLSGGEVVISIQGSVGRVAVVPSELAGGNVSRTLAMIRLKDPELAPWVHRALESPASQAAMRAVVGGTTRDSLNLRDLRRIQVPVAPASVRSQILRLIDSSMSKVASSTQHLRAARRTSERFRQAVLTSACSGRLTAEWREEHEAFVSGELVSSANDQEERVDLPQSWVVARVADLGTVQLGGTPSRKESSYWFGDVPWVSSGEVANCRISTTRETISQSGLANSSAKVYQAGTVLIAMIGEGKTRGQSAILDIAASTNQNAAGILPDRRFVDPEYLWRWALSQYEATRAVGAGGNQPALNKQRVSDLIVPVPPLEEQAEIVRRVDQLLGVGELLVGRIEIASNRLDRISQALLAKAFRGELISSGP